MVKINKNLKCLVCGNGENKNFFSLGKRDEYEIFKCANCRFEFVYPMKPGNQNYYEDSYSALGGGYGEDKWNYKRFLVDAEKFSIKGKLFEIGCGPGWFLKDAKNYGFEVYGIDFNREAIQYAKSIQLANVKVADISKLDEQFLNIKFNTVVFFHVLEHLNDPELILKKVSGLLEKDGILAISVPNLNRSSLKFLLGKEREGWDYPPHHMTRWDKDNLSQFLMENGFEPFFIEEERISGLNKNLNFLRGIFHLLMSSRSLSQIKAESQISRKYEYSLRKKLFLIVKFLSLFKKGAIILFSLILLPIIYFASIFIFIKGTNLYILARKIN